MAGVLLGHHLTTSYKMTNQYTTNLKGYSVEYIAHLVSEVLVCVFYGGQCIISLCLCVECFFSLLKATLSIRSIRLPSIAEYGRSLNILLSDDPLR